MKNEAEITEQEKCCAPSKCISADEHDEMFSVCCDAGVCGGRAWEPYTYRCKACGKHLSLRKHHAGNAQVYWRRSDD